MRRQATMLLGVLAVATALAGCASPSGTGTSTRAVVAPSTGVTADPGEVSAAWLDDGRLIGLVTSGSSSCVPVESDATIGATGTLTVTLDDPDGACTRDDAPRVTVVAVPADVDPSADLAIVLAGGYTGGTSLAGVSGLAGGGETEYLPSAGWTGQGDQLVILTFGSSGCPPVVSAVDPTGPAALTVTFETPPADQVCTADIGPRATLVTATGLDSCTATQLTLAGGADFQTPVTIPISGRP